MVMSIFGHKRVGLKIILMASISNVCERWWGGGARWVGLGRWVSVGESGRGYREGGEREREKNTCTILFALRLYLSSIGHESDTTRNSRSDA